MEEEPEEEKEETEEEQGEVKGFQLLPARLLILSRASSALSRKSLFDPDT